MILNVIKAYFRGLGLRGVINWILLVIIIVGGVKACYKESEYREKIDSLSKVKPKPQTETSLEAEKIAEEVNEKGDTVVIFERADPIIKTIEMKIEDQRKVDSLLKINNIKEKNLQQLSTLYAEANAKNLKLTQQLADNGKDTVWRFKDKYLTNTIYRRDTAFVSDIWLDATVSRVDYTKKSSWFFGENQDLTKVWFNSPYIKPQGMDNLTIVKKEPFFDWGVNIEGRYMHSDKQLIMGPRANIKLGRFNISGGYGLNTGTGTGQVWYGGDYRIK